MDVMETSPCKGKSADNRKLLPFQGAYTAAFIPRAMPWAKCLMAFQAAYILL